MTEILFKSKLPHNEENKLPPNANIQDTDPLVWHLDSVRDVLHVLTVGNFVLHSAAEFLCERKSAIFFRRHKQRSILHRQNLTSQSDRASSFLATVRGFETHKAATIKILCHPSRPTDYGRVITSLAATRVFLPTTNGDSGERQ